MVFAGLLWILIKKCCHIKYLLIRSIVEKFQFPNSFSVMIQIHQNRSLRDYNSFHLDVIAAYFVSIKSAQDIQDLIVDPIFLENKRLIV